jgi:hypothetical protein
VVFVEVTAVRLDGTNCKNGESLFVETGKTVDLLAASMGTSSQFVITSTRTKI